MKQLIIDQAVLEQFPQFLCGVVVVHNLNNQINLDQVNTFVRQIEPVVQQTFTQFETPTQHPHIAAWRKAFKQFGCDPSDYRNSAEALVRQILKGNSIWGINPLVDLYNYISLKYVLPVGGEDIAMLDGDLHLAVARGQEQFIRLGGTDNEPPEPGEIVYKDMTGVICRRWNWREAERTKLTTQTSSAVIVIDALPPATEQTVRAAAQELAVLLERWCGGTVIIDILDKYQLTRALN